MADPLLAALSIGVPMGLSISFASTNRDWSAKTKSSGFAAALGGALTHAWLGFGVTAERTGLFAAVVGSVVNATLVLLVLDMARDLRIRDRFAAPRRKRHSQRTP